MGDLSEGESLGALSFYRTRSCFQRVFARFVSNKMSNNSAFIGTTSAATPAVRRSVAICVGKSVL